MEKIIVKTASALALIIIVFTACKKENVPKPLILQTPFSLTPEQEANLKSYKASSHSIMFGWYNYSPQSPSMQTRLTGLPDSIDMVSYFIGYTNTDQNKADVKYVQQHWGTKVLVTLFPDHYIATHQNESIDSIIKYAENLADSINSWGLDGFDLDYEPHYGGDGYSDEQFKAFIVTMGKYFGPKSGTGKTLVVDGEWLYPELSDYINYFIVQAYNSSSNSELDFRLQQAQSNGLPPEKVILAEWTSQSGNSFGTGGTDFTQPDGTIIPSLLGMAKYNPPNGRKGGVGCYVIQFSYSSPADPLDYVYPRQAIQIMNPAVQ